MSDDSSVRDFNTSQDRKLHGRFRNLFTKLNKKERELSINPILFDIQKLLPPGTAIAGVLNVKFYMSNEPQAYWSVLIATKLHLYDNYDRLSTNSPNYIFNMLDFKFQKGPPSESKFKLLHNQNSVENIQIEAATIHSWTKSIVAISSTFDISDDIADEDEVHPVYDVPKKGTRITSVVITQDNEISIYDVPSEKPRVVKQESTPPQQRPEDMYDVPSKTLRLVKSIGTPPQQRPEDMYDVPSQKPRPVKSEDIPPPDDQAGDMYDVPSNRPVIPPRPNFSYGSVYSDLDSPPNTPTYDHPRNKPIPKSEHPAPKSENSAKSEKSIPTSQQFEKPSLPSRKFELPPALPSPRRPFPSIRASNPEITNIESTNPVSVEGFMKLLTDANQWTKFFFILRDRFLQAFDDVTKLNSPVFMLDLSGSEFTFIPHEESKRKCTFTLESSSLIFNHIQKTSRFAFQNVFMFAADSFRDFKAWRTAIFDIQGLYNISTRSNSYDQLASFDEANLKKAKPIRRVFSSVKRRESTFYGNIEQKFVPEDYVYVSKTKSKSVSLPITSRNSEKIYSRVFETNQGKKPGTAVLTGFLWIFSGEWKKHWFELRNKFLTCFESHESIRTIFEIDLSKCNITEASKETNRDYSFKLTNTLGDIVYFFCADNEVIYTDWITALILISIRKEPISIPTAPEMTNTNISQLSNGSIPGDSSSTSQLKGNLLKRTSNGKWEQRYCVVKDGVMLIYRPNQTTPLQRVQLLDSLVNVSNSLDVLQNHAFEIRVVNSTDTHLFAAFSQSKLDEWLSGLRNASSPKKTSDFLSDNSDKFDSSLETSLNKLTPDLKNSRPPKPSRTGSTREVNTQLDKLPASHLQNPTKVGILDYRTVSSKIWGRRHCIVHDLCLYIYLHPSSEHPQKVFALPGCEIKSSWHETSKYLSFSIEHRTMKAYLSTQSLQDMQTWVEVLTKTANSATHSNENGLECQLNPSEIPHYKIHTSTPNQNMKIGNQLEIESLILQSNKDIFETYFHSNLASTKLRNSIESIQKKRSNLQGHLLKLKQSKQKDPEKAKKIRELLIKYDEAIQEFRVTMESNKTETSTTIAFLEIQLDNSLIGLRSLSLSNGELSLNNGIRGNTQDSETLI